MIKLYRARSLLYRRQILQVNIRWNSYRWKALDEIYKIYMLLHRSDPFFQQNCVGLFRIFLQKIPKTAIKFFQDFSTFSKIFVKFRQKINQNLSKIQ